MSGVVLVEGVEGLMQHLCGHCCIRNSGGARSWLCLTAVQNCYVIKACCELWRASASGSSLQHPVSKLDKRQVCNNGNKAMAEASMQI